MTASDLVPALPLSIQEFRILPCVGLPPTLLVQGRPCCWLHREERAGGRLAGAGGGGSASGERGGEGKDKRSRQGREGG